VAAGAHDSERAWDIRISVAVQASDEAQARLITGEVVGRIAVSLLVPPAFRQYGEVWVADVFAGNDFTYAEAEDVLSALTGTGFPVPGVSWTAPRTRRVGDPDSFPLAVREWPPSIFHLVENPEMLVDPAVRGVLLQVWRGGEAPWLSAMTGSSPHPRA